MGFRLSKIYTRTGDKGETGLGDGRRVPKDHPRVEAIGEVDTLNSQLGLLLANLEEQSGKHPALKDVIEVLTPCQHRLFDLGGELAMPVYKALNAAEVDRLEAAIDRWNEEVGPLENFILPGGSALIAQAHVCRSLARSAERRCQHLNAVEPLEGVGLAYINRLSDLLFVAARVIAKRQGVAECCGRRRPSHTEQIVPTLCVGMHQRTLRVPKRNAERRRRHSHAERGNDQHDQQSVGTLITPAARTPEYLPHLAHQPPKLAPAAPAQPRPTETPAC